VTKEEVSFPEPEWNLLAQGMRVLNCHREEEEMLCGDKESIASILWSKMGK